jgi:hypothetical protein
VQDACDVAFSVQLSELVTAAAGYRKLHLDDIIASAVLFSSFEAPVGKSFLLILAGGAADIPQIILMFNL